MTCRVEQLIKEQRELRDETGDPWDGRSLEWATPSPPPFFNFAVMPNVEGEEAYWGIKLKAIESQQLSPELCSRSLRPHTLRARGRGPAGRRSTRARQL